jgi:hypothetical protein
MKQILWPFMLESMTPIDYAPAFAILCKVVADVAKRRQSEEDFFVDFDDSTNGIRYLKLLFTL